MSHSPHSIVLASLACGLLTVSGIHAEDVIIRIEADQVVGPVSRCLTGACIEDVNHEIYGGIYSQMIFGESFQEPAPRRPAKVPRRSAACGGPCGAARQPAASRSPPSGRLPASSRSS